MRLGIKGKQIAGVTALVGCVVLALSALYVARITAVVLHESHARGLLLSNAIFHRAREVVTGSPAPYEALRTDPGLRAILESSIYSESVTGASILDTTGIIIASSDSTRVGLTIDDRPDLAPLLERSAIDQLRVVYSPGQTLDVRQPMMLGDEAFGAIRIGVSTVLMRQEVNAALRPALVTGAAALGIAVLVAALLAQLLLRPIHVIRSGLTRLGKGEFGVTLDLPPGDEFGELGSFFNTVSQQLSVDRTQLAGQKAHLQSAVEHLEDAVALFNPAGELLFSNRAMQPALGTEAVGRSIRQLLPDGHAYRTIVEETLSTRRSRGPLQVHLQPQVVVEDRGGDGADRGADDVLLMTHAIEGTGGGLVAVLLVARDLAYLSRVQSTLAFSRKLMALGRLTAGVAHEVKNPLNAMMIHLELLRTKIRSATWSPAVQPVAVPGGLGLAAGPDPAVQGALQHVEVIEGAIRRLDEVVQGFLKFSRPEDLRLQPVSIAALLQELLPLVEPEAQANHVKIVVDAPASLPEVNADAAMLRQALLNLAINGCQAMPAGGTLRLGAAEGPRRMIEIRVEDTGVGIPADRLGKIFDLYYTTKDRGTGIGLSMVYRIIQLHDGELDVQSTPGSGTTFTIMLPRASEA